jgi:hypothetical protein
MRCSLNAKKREHRSNEIGRLAKYRETQTEKKLIVAEPVQSLCREAWSDSERGEARRGEVGRQQLCRASIIIRSVDESLLSLSLSLC